MHQHLIVAAALCAVFSSSKIAPSQARAGDTTAIPFERKAVGLTRVEREARAQGAAPAERASRESSGPERVQVRGFARDLSGKAWQGAELRFYSTLPLVGTTRRSVDEIRVVADERGRFEADLLATRRYMAFATQELGEGLWRCSQVEIVRAPTRRIALRETNVRYPRITLRVAPGEEGAVQPREVLVRAPLFGGGQGAGAALLGRSLSAFSVQWRVRIKDSAFALPLLPCEYVGLEVLDERGARVAMAGLAIADFQRRKILEQGQQAKANPLFRMLSQSSGALTIANTMTESTLELHATSSVEVELRDEQEKPRAATLLQFVDGRRVLLAESDAKGVARFDLPVHATSRQESMQRIPTFVVFAEAEGLALTRIQHATGNPLLQVIQARAGGSAVAAAKIGAAAKVEGRVVRKGVELGRLRLAYRCRSLAQQMLFSIQHQVWNDLVPMRCDAKGRFAMPIVERNSFFELYALIDDELAAALGVSAGPALIWSGKVEKRADLGTIDLADLRVAGRVQRADGSPEDRGRLQLMLMHTRTARGLSASAVTDGQGRFAMLLPKPKQRESLRLVVLGSQGYKIADAAALGQDALRLPDLRINVRVMGDDGPKKGYYCSCYIRANPASNPEMVWLPQVASAMFSARSDKEGRCTLWRYADVPIDLGVYTGERGGKSVRKRIEDDEAKSEITIRF